MATSEAFQISIPYGGKPNEIEVIPITEKDQVLYEIRQKADNNSFVVGLNEDAQWEANSDINETLVSAVGKAIDEHESRLTQ